MATALSDNLFVRNGQLYIKPTLTSNALSDPQQIFNKGNYTLQGCTTSKTNASACSASSSNTNGATIPPVMSARLSTRGSYSIRFGKVEVVAKLPRGDWLWPAIWMAPLDSVYGPWPLSGEIDVRSARLVIGIICGDMDMLRSLYHRSWRLVETAPRTPHKA